MRKSILVHKLDMHRFRESAIQPEAFTYHPATRILRAKSNISKEMQFLKRM